MVFGHRAGLDQPIDASGASGNEVGGFQCLVDLWEPGEAGCLGLVATLDEALDDFDVVRKRRHEIASVRRNSHPNGLNIGERVVDIVGGIVNALEAGLGEAVAKGLHGALARAARVRPGDDAWDQMFDAQQLVGVVVEDGGMVVDGEVGASIHQRILQAIARRAIWRFGSIVIRSLPSIPNVSRRHPQRISSLAPDRWR